MSLLCTLLLAAISITAGDRLAMADRLFNKGAYEDALKEYKVIYRNDGSDKDDLLYRLAECYRALGSGVESRRIYLLLVKNFPASKYAHRSRLMAALAVEGPARKVR